MDVNIQISGDLEFRRSTKTPDRGQLRFMGGSCFVSDVPDQVPNGHLKVANCTGEFWSDGSLRVKKWISNGVEPAKSPSKQDDK